MKPLFCERGPVCYRISVIKETALRFVRDLFCSARFAKKRETSLLPHIVKSHTSLMLRKLHGVDMALQHGKVQNIRLACEKINGLVIQPGETFSYWRTCGRPSKRRGYREGLVIRRRGELSSGIGGGLCQMANMIHWLVLNSPLTVTELHHHTDALFPDAGRRVPFGTGTSISYNYIDYRFENITDQPVQLAVWIDGDTLCGELRTTAPYPCRYRLLEENHRFVKEGDDYYRLSQVVRETIDRQSGAVINREVVLDNHSLVMYDHALIPPEEIAHV